MWPTSNDPAVQFLLDRAAISELMTRYCRSIDRCDRPLLESTYWPDAWDDHNIFRGTALEYFDFIIPWREGHEQTQHMLGNMSIRLDGIDADVETYFICYHRHREPGGAVDMFVGGRYIDRMRKRDGEWRIADRKGVVDWWRHAGKAEDYSGGYSGMVPRMGGMAPNDAVYDLFGPKGRTDFK